MSDVMTTTSDYWRNRDGSIVHTNDCIYSGSKGAVPWLFADGKAEWQVRMLVADTPWLSLCGRCFTEEAPQERRPKVRAVPRYVTLPVTDTLIEENNDE